MALVPMKKVRLVGLLGEKDAMLKKLQRIGVVQLQEQEIDDELSLMGVCRGNDEKALQLHAKLAELESCIKVLKPHSQTKQGLLSPKPGITPDSLMQTEMSQADSAMDQCKRLEAEMLEQRSKLARIENQRALMTNWQDLPVPLEDIHATRHTDMRLGIFAETLETAQLAVLEAAPTAAVYKVGASKEGISLVVLAHKSEMADALQALRQTGFADANFEGMTGTPRHILEDFHKQKLELEKQAEVTTTSLVELAKSLPLLQRAYDYIAALRDREQAASQLATTESTFVLYGWLRADREQELQAAAREVLGDAFVVEFSEPTDEDFIPTEMDNPRLVQPFEVVTDLYSPPDARGLDPNPYMAPFYFLLFGMMLSDAAYGVILAIGCFFFLKRAKPSGMMKQLIGLIGLCGIATIFWGIMYGSYFGVELFKPVLFSPMTSPLPMLGLCFGLGLIHILTGLILKMKMEFKRKNYFNTICDQGLWVLLLVGIVVWVVPMLLPSFPAIIGTIGLVMVLAGAVGLVLTGGRQQKNIFKKFTSGLLSLYDITGYLSDVLSYSRLFALGLATGVIAQLFNQIGGMLAGGVIGYFFMVVIIVVGHVFNIAINTLGAFVHASRLQYIEFYGKFYESGGKRFAPLCYNPRFLRLE